MPEKLPPLSEAMFLRDYQKVAKKMNLSMDPDDPLHFYDYRAAWKAGDLDIAGDHFSSKYKLSGHPRYYVSPDGKLGSPKPVKGWLDTTTMKIIE